MEQDPPPVSPSFPPPPGYDIAFNSYQLVPPSFPRPSPEVVKYSEISRNAQAVDREVARDALLRYIDTTCCWGTGPAKEATIETEVWSSIACTLETFIEYREAGWKEIPYRNEPFTALGQGNAPQPWQLPAQPIAHFVPTTEVLEVPYTSTIIVCNECHGNRKVRCTNCGGDGKVKCTSCNGKGERTVYRDGERDEVRCDNCGGDGTKKCKYSDCDHGKITCPTCQGTGRLRRYAVVNRTHEILTNSKVIDSIPDSELPPDLIVAAGGLEILRAQAVNIAPPQGFSPDLDSALVELDATATNQTISKNGYLHQERLVIKAVPVSKATGRVDNVTFHFWVYGTENRCHIREEWGYPAQMCCGCNLS